MRFLWAMVWVVSSTAGCGDEPRDCGDGTVLRGDSCVSAFSPVDCGEGTREEDGVCVDVESVECGPDTVLEDGRCQPGFEEIECGEGTQEVDGQCVSTEPELECGEGTQEVDGQCVSTEPELECGPGTEESEGVCVPTYPELQCGPMTEERDGTCVLSETLVECGYGTVLRGDHCIDAELQFVAMPFAEGREVHVSQGHHGSFSHNGNSAYAADFPVPEGTTVVAARWGQVLATRADSNTGCGEPRCAGDANYVIMVHCKNHSVGTNLGRVLNKNLGVVPTDFCFRAGKRLNRWKEIRTSPQAPRCPRPPNSLESSACLTTSVLWW